MFDSKSGRVTIQQEWNATRISVRGSRDWSLLFLVVWLGMWVTMPFQTVVAAVRSLAHPESLQLFQLLWSVAWLFGICFAVSAIAWSLGGKDSLTLSASELSLSSTLFGVAIRQRTAPTSEVRNLRFAPSYRRGRKHTPSKIAFEDARGTVRFASGLEDSEALALIEAMLAVYPFPKRDRALEYIDSGH